MTRCGRDRSPWVLVVFYIILHFLLYFHLLRIRRGFQAFMST